MEIKDTHAIAPSEIKVKYNSFDFLHSLELISCEASQENKDDDTEVRLLEAI